MRHRRYVHGPDRRGRCRQARTCSRASTTPTDPVEGVINAVKLAAEAAGTSLGEYLARADTFIHGTTHAINAVITGRTARTALLTTQGHPDVLVLREGGRTEPFNFTIPYPEPYIPRSLTYEVPERVGSDGRIIKPLDEAVVIALCVQLREAKVEAVAVALLWSVANAAHEQRVGDILAEHLSGIPVTLSSTLNPTIREFRRASSAAIDASLRPLMGSYLGSLAQRLKDAGFDGRLLVLTSQGRDGRRGIDSAITDSRYQFRSLAGANCRQTFRRAGERRRRHRRRRYRWHDL